MKINLDFGNLCEAFEMCNSPHHFFIDLEKNELTKINEEIDDDSDENLEKINEEKYLNIPEGTSADKFITKIEEILTEQEKQK